MDELFGDQSMPSNEWLDSLQSHKSGYDLEEESVCEPKSTTITKVLDISPIRKTHNEDITFGTVYDFESDLSFDKYKSYRKYCSAKKSLNFSPIMRSTPKPSKTQTSRRSQRIRKKSHKKQMSVSLWDKAIHKNPQLKEWIHSFNEDMKKIESSELSITESSQVSND